MKDRHLISADELRAAGALDVPASWRKSLGGEPERLLFGDDDMLPEKQPPPPHEADAECNAAAETTKD